MARRIVEKSLSAIGGILLAGRIIIKDFKSDRRVTLARCKAEKRRITLSGIVAGIASIRWRINGPSRGRDRERDEREQRDRKIDNICSGGVMVVCFHRLVVSSG